ncbi:hypothetical protein L596_022166 [Steinernema carpocapsae]|uniref:Uncharacterized protein n=2 Tax=Steinernema carpocapsae TaxID=34508 RepID=A0A4U5MKW2_STECR|nr:hypothetical protein L596_022166 [Steinernema carpocapsae]
MSLPDPDHPSTSRSSQPQHEDDLEGAEDNFVLYDEDTKWLIEGTIKTQRYVKYITAPRQMIRCIKLVRTSRSDIFHFLATADQGGGIATFQVQEESERKITCIRSKKLPFFNPDSSVYAKKGIGHQVEACVVRKNKLCIRDLITDVETTHTLFHANHWLSNVPENSIKVLWSRGRYYLLFADLNILHVWPGPGSESRSFYFADLNSVFALNRAKKDYNTIFMEETDTGLRWFYNKQENAASQVISINGFINADFCEDGLRLLFRDGNGHAWDTRSVLCISQTSSDPNSLHPHFMFLASSKKNSSTYSLGIMEVKWRSMLCPVDCQDPEEQISLLKRLLEERFIETRERKHPPPTLALDPEAGTANQPANRSVESAVDLFKRFSVEDPMTSKAQNVKGPVNAEAEEAEGKGLQEAENGEANDLLAGNGQALMEANEDGRQKHREAEAMEEPHAYSVGCEEDIQEAQNALDSPASPIAEEAKIAESPASPEAQPADAPGMSPRLIIHIPLTCETEGSLEDRETEATGPSSGDSQESNHGSLMMRQEDVENLRSPEANSVEGEDDPQEVAEAEATAEPAGEDQNSERGSLVERDENVGKLPSQVRDLSAVEDLASFSFAVDSERLQKALNIVSKNQLALNVPASPAAEELETVGTTSALESSEDSEFLQEADSPIAHSQLNVDSPASPVAKDREAPQTTTFYSVECEEDLQEAESAISQLALNSCPASAEKLASEAVTMSPKPLVHIPLAYVAEGEAGLQDDKETKPTRQQAGDGQKSEHGSFIVRDKDDENLSTEVKGYLSLDSSKSPEGQNNKTSATGEAGSVEGEYELKEVSGAEATQEPEATRTITGADSMEYEEDLQEAENVIANGHQALDIPTSLVAEQTEVPELSPESMSTTTASEGIDIVEDAQFFKRKLCGSLVKVSDDDLNIEDLAPEAEEPKTPATAATCSVGCEEILATFESAAVNGQLVLDSPASPEPEETGVPEMSPKVPSDDDLNIEDLVPEAPKSTEEVKTSVDYAGIKRVDDGDQAEVLSAQGHCFHREVNSGEPEGSLEAVYRNLYPQCESPETVPEQPGDEEDADAIATASLSQESVTTAIVSVTEAESLSCEESDAVEDVSEKPRAEVAASTTFPTESLIKLTGSHPKHAAYSNKGPSRSGAEKPSEESVLVANFETSPKASSETFCAGSPAKNASLHHRPESKEPVLQLSASGFQVSPEAFSNVSRNGNSNDSYRAENALSHHSSCSEDVVLQPPAGPAVSCEPEAPVNQKLIPKRLFPPYYRLALRMDLTNLNRAKLLNRPLCELLQNLNLIAANRLGEHSRQDRSASPPTPLRVKTSG